MTTENNVRSLPLETHDILRYAIETWKDYMAANKPNPQTSELALFDSVVLSQLSFGVSADVATANAVTIVKARRALQTT